MFVEAEHTMYAESNAYYSLLLLQLIGGCMLPRRLLQGSTCTLYPATLRHVQLLLLRADACVSHLPFP